MQIKPEKYLRYLLPNIFDLFGTERTKEILSVNPTIIPQREEAANTVITGYVYNKENINELKNLTVEEAIALKCDDKIIWLNIDGLRKQDVEKIGAHYGVHPLLIEDILSINQRPKMDEIDNILFSLVSMLYFNDQRKAVEQEQISLVLGRNFVITFQDDPSRDVFNALRDRLKLPTSKTRTKEVDYLYYTLLDTIVDHYFIVMDKVGDEIESLEAEIIKSSGKRTLAYINKLRKEQIVLKRSVYPVREVISGIIKSDSILLTANNERYYKDVYDHIMQAIDLTDNQKDVITTMQDLHLNNLNLKMNEVMKVMAVVTCLLAPATIIGGIFGMNFGDMPLLKNHYGFWLAIGAMVIIPVLMLIIFKKRDWF